jgi:hypothetical protein
VQHDTRVALSLSRWERRERSYTAPDAACGGLASGRPETIDEMAEMVTACGGVGIPVQMDHTLPEQVKLLMQRIREERDG